MRAARRRRAARNAARRGRTTASTRPPPRRRALLVGMEHRWLLASWGTENRGAARQRVDGVRETRHSSCCEVRRRRSGAVCRRYIRPPPWRGGAPPNWLVFRGAASCRRRAAGKHQASPFELPCGLPPPQDSAATLAVRAPLQFCSVRAGSLLSRRRRYGAAKASEDHSPAELEETTKTRASQTNSLGSALLLAREEATTQPDQRKAVPRDRFRISQSFDIAAGP